jgi:patatin-like phospholipase/acyl hydrolase
VLSIDGGTVRGLIPAIVVSYMEDRAFEIATTKGYIRKEDYPRNKMPMCELFDMISGTASGGILAAGLTSPSKEDITKPRYFANDLYPLYETLEHKVFKP